MNILKITSPTNQTIKDLVRLRDRKGDKASSTFLVEGLRELERAIKCGFELLDLYVCGDYFNQDARDIGLTLNAKRIAEVSKEAFDKLALREKSDGLIAIFKQRPQSFQNILDRANGKPLLIVAVEHLEKPGNLGALLRTADAAGLHGVVILGQSIDVWNPNVIRNSLGGVFSVPVISLSYEDFFERCKQHKIATYGAALHTSSLSLYHASFKSDSAIVLGSEANGLSPFIMNRLDAKIVIPMHGICDSLNISVAASIIMYEALRQRSLLS